MNSIALGVNQIRFLLTGIWVIAFAATIAACAQRSVSAGASSQVSAGAAPVALDSGETFYPVVRGRRGAVVGGNSFTAQAGFRLLVGGGNAIDAGVAMVLAAAVTEFDNFGFGGEVPILIYLAERDEVVLINGVGFAPEASRADLFDAEEFASAANGSKSTSCLAWAGQMRIKTSITEMDVV